MSNAPFLAASIEMSVKQAAEMADVSAMIPKGTSVYITDMGHDDDRLLAGAKRLSSLGYTCVPHIAVRRLASQHALERRLKRLSQEASVTSALVIAGGVDKPAGPFPSALSALQTGMFERFGFYQIAIAGHPETNPAFSDDVAYQALIEKQAYAHHAGLDMHIVTQFGFDGQMFCNWADGLRYHGITLPVHLGLAGPAKLPTLLKFAISCGVGNFIHFLKNKAGSILSLPAGFDPDDIMDPIEAHVQSRADGAVAKVHIFPFGGVKKTSAFLHERGNWGRVSGRS